MPEPVAIIGAPASPYVRKVLAALEIKGISYTLDPVVPFYGNDEFTRLSPLRRIPVLVDGDLVLPDSTVICEYLEDRHPTPPLLPRGPAARAHARWLEEFADTRMGDVFIWSLFSPAVSTPGIFNTERDEAAFARVVAEDLPPVMNLLEAEAPDDGFLTGTVSTADLSIAVHFANLRWARVGADLSAWPRTQAWVARTEQATPLGRITAFGERFLTTRFPDRPALFAEFGIPMAPTTLAGRVPRRGPMSVV